jgi:hypothetical protein
MSRLLMLVLTISLSAITHAQTGYIVLRKNNRSQRFFWRDSHFTFQTADGQWTSGIVTKIGKDSFFLTQEIIRYQTMGFDTLHVSGFQFAVSDIVAIPTRNASVDYNNDQVEIGPGHEKFIWVRNGLIFQLIGGGWVALNVINDLGRKDPPFQKKKLAGLGIGMAAFIVGTILHKSFDPYIRIGKKYQLELVPIATPPKETEPPRY